MNSLLSKCINLRNTYILTHLSYTTPSNFKRYFATYDIDWRSQRLSVLLGARGIGKTTALLQIIWEELGFDFEKISCLYVPIDHFKLKGVSLYTIGETFAEYGGTLLCIDEIHTYSNWAQELKSLYDTFPNLRVIASGSSILEIQKGTQDLSRRAYFYTVYGMSFREYLEFKHKELILQPASFSLSQIITHHQAFCRGITTQLEEKKISVLLEFQDYLKTGYYPYFKNIKNEGIFFQTLEQQVHMTIESDIPHLYPAFTNATTKKVTNLLSFISQSVPYETNFEKLKEYLGIGDIRTIKHYLKILENSSLIQTLPKYKHGLKSLSDKGKIYLQNTNLQQALVEIPNKGTLRETFFMTMLKQQGCELFIPNKGDFLTVLEGKEIVFEIGGKGKDRTQIHDIKNSYIVADDISIGGHLKIPLWLFGFLY